MAVERFPVETGHIQMFAEAIGDPNPVYRDENAAKECGLAGVIAPPTFVQASAHFDPNYPLRPSIGEPWFGSGRTPTGVTPSGSNGDGGGTGLHAEQHYEYHRPLYAGEMLFATTQPGRTWEKQGRRSGTLRFSETITEYRNRTGELMVTARSVAVLTSRPVEGKEEGR
jgi:hypothetical protein